MEPSDEFLMLSRQERVDTLRGTPWIRTRWLYLLLLAAGLSAVTVTLLVAAAMKDNSTSVGLAIVVGVPALLLGWAAWGTRSLARREDPRLTGTRLGPRTPTEDGNQPE